MRITEQSGKQSTAKKVRISSTLIKQNSPTYSNDNSSQSDDEYGDEYSSDEEHRPPQMVEVSSEESLYEENDFDILTSDRFFEQMQAAFSTLKGNLGLPQAKTMMSDGSQMKTGNQQPHKLLQSLIGGSGGINPKQTSIQTVKNIQNEHQLHLKNQTDDNNGNAHMLVDEEDGSSCVSPFKSGQYEIDHATGLPKMPAYDKNLNYIDEYWNIYLQNQALLSQIDKIANDRNDLLMKNFKIETFYDQNLDRLQSERYSSGRKKHHRRCANDIERRYKCPYQKCEKFYGSEGSLNLHIKIKHGGGNKTDREKIAKSIVFAKANGINMSAESLMGELNLPPGAVERAAAQVGVKLDDDQIKKLEADLIQKQEIKKKKEIELMKQQMIQQQQQLLIQTEIAPSHHLSAKKSPVLHPRSLRDQPANSLLGLVDNNQGSSSGVFKVPPLPQTIQMKKSASFINTKSNSENDAMVRNSNNQQLQNTHLSEAQVNQQIELKKSLSAASATTPKFTSLSAGSKKEEGENTPMLEVLEIGAKSLSGGLPSLTAAISSGADSASKKARVQHQQAMSTRSSRRL